jgi:hypothetical protein
MALQQRNRERPALMSVSVNAEAEDADSGAGSGAAAHQAAGDAAQQDAAGAAALEVTLWRADAVAAVVEVDSKLEITRADAAAGLLFGFNHRAMIKKDFKR